MMNLISSCSNRLKPYQYLHNYEKNSRKYCTSIERNGFKVTVQFLPAEYYAAQELAARVTDNVDTALKKYANSIFVKVTIKSIDNSKDGTFLLRRNGMKSYSANVNNNSFNKEKNMFLYCQADTLTARDYQYERNWGIGNGDTFLAVFDKRQLKHKLNKYNFVVSDLSQQIGTVDIRLNSMIINSGKLIRG